MTENSITLALSLPADLAKTIDPAELTESQKNDFIAGWKDAGGYVGDIETPQPWCAPWTWTRELEVVGADPYEWGVDHCKTIQEETEASWAEFEAEMAAYKSEA